MKVGDILYRYTDDGYQSGFRLRRYQSGFRLRRYEVEKLTEQRAEIREVFGDFKSSRPRRIKPGARRPYAHPNEQDAAYAYYKRKRRQVEILETQLVWAKIRRNDISKLAGKEAEEENELERKMEWVPHADQIRE